MFILTTTKKMITLTCDKCGKEYEISEQQSKNRIKRNIPNYCKPCMREYSNQKKRDYYNNLSDEEKKAYNEKRNWYSRATDEQKEAHRQKMRDIQASKTPEQLEEERRKNSEGLKRHWKTVSEEDKSKRITNMHIGNREYWDNMTSEERSKQASDRYWNLPDEERKRLHDIYSARAIKHNAETPMEVKLERVKAMQKWHANLTPEQKKEFYQRTHAWWYKLDDNEKRNIADEKRAWYDNLSIEEKEDHVRQSTIQQHEQNKLHKRFDELVNGYHLNDIFRFVPEDPHTNHETRYLHVWDYGIYDKDNNLVMVVDIDGSLYHAISRDYDGSFSKEERDVVRSLSLTQRVKIYIIPEDNFDQSFDQMVKFLRMTYDEYVNYLFSIYRNVLFPEPRYSSKLLKNSYISLIKLSINNKYYQDISRNCRIGDMLIFNFHHSIYYGNYKGYMSPLELWMNDNALKKEIDSNRLYYTDLNPNRITQGFIISENAPRISVFSAAHAKILIEKYLSKYDVVFNPFNGFSGILLGTVSLNKKYIGQDISPIVVNESNELIKFISQFGIDAAVSQCDVLQSSGTYECLFTCLPDENEEYFEVITECKSCDEWIDICLQRFKCHKYLFIANNTERYKDNVVDIITINYGNRTIEKYVICIDS